MSESLESSREPGPRVTVGTVGLSRFDPAALSHVVVGGEFEHRRLPGGGSDIGLLRCALPHSAIDRGRYAPAVLVSGTFGRDTVTLGAMLAQRRPTVVNAVDVELGTVQLYAEHTELCYRAWPDATWFAFSVGRERLDAFCREQFDAVPAVASTGGGGSGGGVTHFEPLSPDAGRQLIDDLRDLDGSLPALADVADPARIGQAVEQDLLARLGGVLCRRSPTQANGRGERRRMRRCREMLRHAMALVDADPAETLDLRAMARATGLEPRTLQRTFRAACGMCPHEWFRVERLNRVHDDLTHGRNGGSVTRTATRWGFFHLGRFARYYHALFGERPRDTARRAHAGPRRINA